MVKYCLYVGCVLVFCVVFTTPATAELITNGSFEGLTTQDLWHGSLYWTYSSDGNGDNFSEWYGSSIYWAITGGGSDGANAAMLSPCFGTMTLLQVIQNDNELTGEHTLTFDLKGRWSGGVSVFGLAEMETILLSYGRPSSAGDGLIMMGGAPTYYGLDGAYASWTPKPVTVDFGDSGYKYILVTFSSRVQDSNDSPMLDNVSLTPEPATLSLLGLGGLLFLRRRRR